MKKNIIFSENIHVKITLQNTQNYKMFKNFTPLFSPYHKILAKFDTQLTLFKFYMPNVLMDKLMLMLSLFILPLYVHVFMYVCNELQTPSSKLKTR